MSAILANVAVGAAVLLTGVSLLLTTLGALSWRRLRHGRLLWITLAFAMFTAKGAYLTERAYQTRGELGGGLEAVLPTVVLADLAIVLALYLAAWKP